MIENAAKFFELYESDEALRARVEAAEAAYPGSLEIREAVVEEVLLPIAEEIGLPFDIKSLRAYETRVKMSRLNDEDYDTEKEQVFWLLDHGWTDDEDKLKNAKKN